MTAITSMGVRTRGIVYAVCAAAAGRISSPPSRAGTSDASWHHVVHAAIEQTDCVCARLADTMCRCRPDPRG
jgi:hypothetical protein